MAVQTLKVYTLGVYPPSRYGREGDAVSSLAEQHLIIIEFTQFLVRHIGTRLWSYTVTVASLRINHVTS